jgi:hypothetical protein
LRAWRLQIVNRSDAAGFEVLPQRWIVERTFAWIVATVALPATSKRYATTAAFIRLAMIRIMLRRLAANTSRRMASQRQPHVISNRSGIEPNFRYGVQVDCQKVYAGCRSRVIHCSFRGRSHEASHCVSHNFDGRSRQRLRPAPQDHRVTVQADALKWSAPAAYAKGAQLAVMKGDPTKEGMYVVRLKVPAGFRSVLDERRG